MTRQEQRLLGYRSRLANERQSLVDAYIAARTAGTMTETDDKAALERINLLQDRIRDWTVAIEELREYEACGPVAA